MRKKDKKYSWIIGEDPPDLDEHSHTKHLIVADYLQRYVEVYMSNATIERLPLTIVDGFSGGGKYKSFDSEEITDGSPFLMLKSIREAEALINVGRRKPRFIDAEYHFIEKDKPHLDYLRHEVSASEFSHLIQESRINFYEEDFGTAGNRIVNHIITRKKGKRALFILDQYSYKDVPFSLVNKIFQQTNGEIILTFNFDNLQSFISDNSVNRKALENINLAQYIDWKRLNIYKEAGMWKEAIQEQLAGAIYRASGAKHMTLFFIKPKKGWCYWLVHLSKVYKARDVMMDLHWKHSNTSSEFEHFLGDGIFSLGFKATNVAGQDVFDFGDDFNFGDEAKERCINNLSEQIPKILYDSKKIEMPFSELTDQIGSNTAASSAEIKQSLQKSIDNKELLIIPRAGKGKPRRSALQISGNDIVRYNQTQIIFT